METTLSPEKIAELKKTHGRLLRADINYLDASKKPQRIDIYFRPPTMDEIERLQSTAQKSPRVGNMELLRTVIVHPDAKGVVDALQDLPAVVGRFVQDEIMPFLGEYKGAEIKEL